MKQSDPYRSSITFRKPAGIFRRPLSSTVGGPSRRELSAEERRREFRAIFDRAAAHGLTAIFLQVRPIADALYPSPIEPWSEFLGAPPSYDPLAYAVNAAHARWLALNAWF